MTEEKIPDYMQEGDCFPALSENASKKSIEEYANMWERSYYKAVEKANKLIHKKVLEIESYLGQLKSKEFLITNQCYKIAELENKVNVLKEVIELQVNVMLSREE